jgi:hypothetical protein
MIDNHVFILDNLIRSPKNLSENCIGGVTKKASQKCGAFFMTVAN